MARETFTGQHIEAEIFSTGTWNGETFVRKDLEEIARNFERFKGQLKPPLKFGHDEQQTLIGQLDGDPALGWVEGLRVVGDKLVATFAGVPEVVYRAILNRRYRRVSAEIYFNVRKHGKNLGKALKAVALLGADLPAVTNLEDLAAFLTDRPPFRLQVGDSRVFTLPMSEVHPNPIDEEHSAMNEPNEKNPLEDELDELRTYKARQEQRYIQEQSHLKKQAFHSAREEVRAFTRQLTEDGRLTPHFRERLLQEIEAQAHQFKEGEGLRVSMGWVRSFLMDSPPRLPSSEVGFSGSDETVAPEGEDNPSMALARMASAKMVEMKLSYGQAAAYVLKNNPALARAYRDYTLNPTIGG